MPKVGRHDYRASNRQDFSAEVNFGIPNRSHTKTSKKQFWIELNKDVSAFHGDNKHVFGETMKEVINAFNQKVEEYVTSSKEVRKVIGYKVNGKIFVDGKRRTQRSNGLGGERFEEVDNIWREGILPEQELSFEYKVGFITKMGSKEFFSFEENDGIKNIIEREYYKPFIFIDHTPEREKWFKETYNSFTALILKLKVFFEQPTDQLLSAIENPAKRLKL